MIQLNSLQLPRQGGEYYTLAFQRLRFALLDAPALDYLSAFSRESQAGLGKTEVRVQMGWLQAYLPFFRDINYILLTQYQEVLLLPFLLRKCPHITVVATTLMYQLARIHLLTFQEKVKDFDATIPALTFDEERDIKELYEEKYQLDMTNSPTIFSRKEAEEALQKIIKVNYHQVYDTERGVLLIAHPSGKNNGSCLWEIQGQANKEKILLVNDISQHQWRTCQPYNIARIKLSDQQKPFDHVIFTRRGLAGLKNQGEEQRAAEAVAKITSNMNNQISTVLILSDQTSAVDLIPRIAFQPQGRCQAAFFSHPSLHDVNNFCNSYVDYLSDSFRNIIFSQSPDYPLIHYSRLSSKGLINVNGLEDTAIKNRMPVREVVLQNAPLVLFIKNYEYLLQMEDLSAIYEHTKFEEIQFNLENNFNKTHFEKFINTFAKAKVYCIGIDANMQGAIALPINIRQVIGESVHPCYIRTANLSASKVQQYKLINNQLQLCPVSREMLLLPRGFMDQICNQFVKRGIPILHKDKTAISTQKTTLSLTEQYILKVTSSHIDEVLVLERIITPMIERLSFK